MTNNTMTDFIEKIKTNTELLKQMVQVAQTGQMEKIRAFLRENGVSEEDIQWGIKFNQNLRTGQTNGELSDEDMELVAGGKGCPLNISHDQSNYEHTQNLCLAMHQSSESHDDGSLMMCAFLYAWVDQGK